MELSKSCSFIVLKTTGNIIAAFIVLLLSTSLAHSQGLLDARVLTLQGAVELAKGKQMLGAKRADEIAEKRYNITKSRYLMGKVSILDLNVATEERTDKATRSFISSLWSFWSAYYTLRRLTLYDFERNMALVQEIPE
ncbi:TolC family protein [Pontibacter harenae]|uniref:TolC family protein n=1 Tax=Pontibacter harenae TaxID=2894083 RepID=UPI001E3534D7|nr:hypothetical protein [Pontibacter harenae]MCC9165668.1 hypothetical protein [Pontibacter harenae]